MTRSGLFVSSFHGQDDDFMASGNLSILRIHFIKCYICNMTRISLDK